MRIFTKRNALIGWMVVRVARRRVRRRLGAGGNGRRRGLLAAGLAATAGASAIALYARRGGAESARAGA